MQTATQQQADLAGPMQRLNALAADALAQYHADMRTGGQPAYPAWVDDVAAVAEALARAQANPLAMQEH